MSPPPATLALSLTLAIFTVGCATKRPVFYPNGHLQQVGRDTAERDIDECFEYASSFGLEAEPEKRAARYTLMGSSYGAAIGGARGAVRGDTGTRAAAGAAGGATAGFLTGMFRWRDPDPIQRNFVGRCLGEQGYSIIGWR